MTGITKGVSFESQEKDEMIKITWEEDGQPAETFTVPDALVQSLERHRLMMTVPKSGPDPAFGRQGGPQEEFKYGPKHDTIRELVVGHLLETLVKPVLETFPTPEIATLKTQVLAAQQALADAHAGIIAGSPGTVPVK
jgi:hypothetical protein